MRRALVPLIALVVLLASAPAASAKEWCVPPASGCADGNVGILQSALNLASSNAGTDSIRLGAATYTPVSGGFTYDDGGSSTNSVAISGVSPDATTLTRSSLGAILTITSGGGALNSLTDLGFHITQSSSSGLQAGRADATRVAVAGDSSITDSTGLTMQYTDYDPATRIDSAPGTKPDPADPTNPNTDPLFVDLPHSDYRLGGASPLIDAGDPAALAADEPNADFAGRPRVVHGRTDIGALEYQRQPPVITSATAKPLATPPGNPFTFSGTATDADGDPLTYSWKFDDGGSAAGASVNHAFAKEGIHVATLTVSDPAGLTASSAVPVGVLPDPRKVLSALSLSPKKFRAGLGKNKGATVRFTLKVPTQVKFTVRRSSKGHKLLGSFARSGVKGKNKFHWRGRVAGKNLKPGGYRLIGTVGSGPNASVRRVNFTVKR